jgi:hypothetical protein
MGIYYPLEGVRSVGAPPIAQARLLPHRAPTERTPSNLKRYKVMSVLLEAVSLEAVRSILFGYT